MLKRVHLRPAFTFLLRKWFIVFLLFTLCFGGAVLFVYKKIEQRVSEPGSLLKVGFSADWEYGTRMRLKHKLTNQAPEQLEKVVSYYNDTFHPDIVIGGGDYVESSGVKPATAKLQLEKINRVFTKVTAPRLYAFGNHDMRVLSKEDVKSILGIAESHAVRDIGEWRVVVLDTNFNKEDDSDRNAKSYEVGYVSKKELEWLAQALKTSRPTIVFSHHSPMNTFNIDNILVENIVNAGEVRALLERHHNIHAVVSGHTPRPQQGTINGVHYFVADTLVNESGLGAFATLELSYNPFSTRADVVFEHYGKNRQTYTGTSWRERDKMKNWWRMAKLVLYQE